LSFLNQASHARNEIPQRGYGWDLVHFDGYLTHTDFL